MLKRFQFGVFVLLCLGCSRVRPMVLDGSVDGNVETSADGNVLDDVGPDGATDVGHPDGAVPCDQAVNIQFASEMGLTDPQNWRVVALETSVDGRVLGLVRNEISGVRYLVNWRVTANAGEPLELLSQLNLNEFWPSGFPDMDNINDQLHIGASGVYLGLRGDFREGGYHANLMILFTGEPLFCWACGATAEVLEVSYGGGGVDFMDGVPGRDTLYLGGQSFGGFGVYREGSTGLLPSSDFASINAIDVLAGSGSPAQDLVAVVSFGRLQVYSGFDLGQANGESENRWNEYFGVRTEFVGDVQWHNQNELFFAERGEAQPIRRLTVGDTEPAIDPQPTLSPRSLEQGVVTSFAVWRLQRVAPRVFAIHNYDSRYQVLSFFNESGNRGWQGHDMGSHRGRPLSIDAISQPSEMVLISGLPGVIRAVPTTCR